MARHSMQDPVRRNQCPISEWCDLGFKHFGPCPPEPADIAPPKKEFRRPEDRPAETPEKLDDSTDQGSVTDA